MNRRVPFAMESFSSASAAISAGANACIESMATDANDANAYEYTEAQHDDRNDCANADAFRMIGGVGASSLLAPTFSQDSDDDHTQSWQAAVTLSFALAAFGLCARVHAPRSRSLLRILAPALAPEAHLLRSHHHSAGTVLVLLVAWGRW